MPALPGHLDFSFGFSDLSLSARVRSVSTGRKQPFSGRRGCLCIFPQPPQAGAIDISTGAVLYLLSAPGQAGHAASGVHFIHALTWPTFIRTRNRPTSKMFRGLL
ncbi:hypothetical protein Zmor_007572 [Zophobas morio]|uniref:Uncharacterized protein n=1 Tax=Zophobas morio TaxID=2755281 RepID=A0AA38J286_9CUCU|nr:hypothetical protein Zmor_007572 [Zophobas morio]